MSTTQSKYQPFEVYEHLFPLLPLPSIQNEHPITKHIPEDQLYDIIESLPESNKFQQLTKANYFCMITFTHTTQLLNTQKVLHSCLQEYQIQYGSQTIQFSYKQHRFILLMIRFNLIVCYMNLNPKQKQLSESKYSKKPQAFPKQLHNQLNQILTQHIGQFHILRKIPQRTPRLNAIQKNYELILFNTFKILQSLANSQNDQEKVNIYKKAFQRIQRKSSYLFKSNQVEETDAQKTSSQVTVLTTIHKNQTKTESKQVPIFKKGSNKESLKDLLKKKSKSLNKVSDKENCVF